MPEKEFDLYLSLLSRLLRLSPEQKAQIDSELRDHLEARFEELVRKGVPRDEAIQWALDEFGDAAGLAQEFTKLSRRNIRRWIMRCTVATAAMGAVVLLVVNAFLPEHRGVPVAQNVVAQDNQVPATPTVDTTPAVEEGDVVRIDPAEFLPPELAQPIDLELVDVPLNKAVKLISERIKAPVFLDQRTLNEVGISNDQPLSESATSEPAFIVLDRMLQNVSGQRLGWYWEDEILHVTTAERQRHMLHTVSYNIRDLLETGYEAEELVDTVQESTRGPWLDVDGEGGTLQRFGDLLVVRQTWSAQPEVGALLNALRTQGRERAVASAADHRLHARLNQIVAVDFRETPLSDVVQRLNEQYGAALMLDSRSLQEVGINIDFPLSSTIPNRPLGVVLKYLFDDIGGQSCEAMIHGGRILVTTQERAEGELRTVVYDAHDIVQEDTMSSEDLADLIMAQTEGPWVEIDGVGGVLARPVPNLFVIRQTQRVHDEVRRLFAETRKAVADAQALGKPVDFESSLPDDVETKYYPMDADTADDLLTVLPEAVAPGTWANSNVDAQGQPLNLQTFGEGTIRKVAAGHKVLHLGGQQVAQSQIADNVDAKPAGGDAADGNARVLVVPQAVLIITQKRSVHRQIREFLQKLSEGSEDNAGRGPGGGGFIGGAGAMGGTGGFGGGLGGGSFGGGGFF